MKAAAYSKFGPPSVLVYQELPDPVCGPSDVLIDVHAVSIEGGDVLARAGGIFSHPGTPIAAIQLAKRAGATVLATASSAEKLERLKPFGLDHGIDYTRDDFVKRARDLTGGAGVRSPFSLVARRGRDPVGDIVGLSNAIRRRQNPGRGTSEFGD